MIAADSHVKNRNVSGAIQRRAMFAWKKLNERAVEGDVGLKTGKGSYLEGATHRDGKTGQKLRHLFFVSSAKESHTTAKCEDRTPSSHECEQ